MIGKPRIELPLHREITQHESGWWLPAQVGGSFAKWQDEAFRHIHETLKGTIGRQCAVQAGCHVGIWARALSEFFDCVHTFEADPVNYECAWLNVGNFDEITLHKAALSDRNGTLPWYRSLSNTGKHKPATKGKVDCQVEAVTIDSLDLPACNLICLDIEGYELPALQGAERTVARYRPVVLFEDLGHAKFHSLPLDGVQKWLTNMGYEHAETVDNDQIWVAK
jgi:FkbM family methyltransferase